MGQIDTSADKRPQMLAAKIAARRLKRAGFEAFIIGGAVRDLLLGKHPKDFDLATNAQPQQILELDGFKKAYYKDTAQAYGITRVSIQVPSHGNNASNDIELEIATYRQDIEAHLGRKATKVAFSTLEDDIKRRDFTINALALDPDEGRIIDLVGGQEDIEAGLVRFIGEAQRRIQEDPLRILRGVRLKNQLEFAYEAGTEAAIRQAAKDKLTDQIAIERLKSELTRLLLNKNRSSGLRDLDDLGLLESVLPEVAACKGVEQPPLLHAEGDVFEHTLLAMGYLPDVISPRLAWATLLHDIGKAPTFSPAIESDRIRFDEHYHVGADMASSLLKRLGFNARFRDEVAWMIRYHLGIDELPNMRPRRAAKFMHHPAFADLLELHKADAQAAWSRDQDGNIDRSPADFSQLEAMWAEFQRQQADHPPSLKRDMGIDGNWLMRTFDLEPGEQLAEILNRLEDAYLNHQIHDRAEAERLAKQLIQR